MIGGAGGDLVDGNAGDDVLDAREPPQRRSADCRRCDRIPPGAGLVLGVVGDDRLLTRDARLDAINCCSGFDVVEADERDRLVTRFEPAGCEAVRRG